MQLKYKQRCLALNELNHFSPRFGNKPKVQMIVLFFIDVLVYNCEFLWSSLAGHPVSEMFRCLQTI